MTMLGKIHTVEAKEKMRQAKLGYTPWNKFPVILRECIRCGKEFKLFGGNGSYIKKYCSHQCYSLSLKGKAPWNKGLNSYTTPTDFRRPEMKSEAYISWRTEVFKRDNYHCRRCFVHSGEGKRVDLIAHHIKPWKDFPELRYDVSNGTTLCVKCHNDRPDYVPLLNRTNSVKPVTAFVGDVGNTEPSISSTVEERACVETMCSDRKV